MTNIYSQQSKALNDSAINRLAQNYIAAVFCHGEKIAHTHYNAALKTLCENNLPTVFMVHGWGADHRCFLPLTDYLQNCNIVLIDMPGFGQNTLSEPSYQNICQHIAVLLPHLSLLVGWSLGGMLLPSITQAARQAGKTVCANVSLAANLQFVQTPFDFDENKNLNISTNISEKTDTHFYPHAMDNKQYCDFIHAFEHTPHALLKRFYRTQAQGDKNMRAVRNTLTTYAPDFNAQNNTSVKQRHAQWLTALKWLAQINNTHLFTKITTPSFHMLGDNDALVPIATAAQFEQLECHRVYVFKDTGHALHVSDPKLAAQEITNFIKHIYGINNIDKNHVARSFSLAATQYHQAAFFQKNMANVLCSYIKNLTGTVVDLGCGTGFCSTELQSKIDALQSNDVKPNSLQTDNTSNAYIIALDISQAMLQQAKKNVTDAEFVCADIESLPFRENSINAFVSNMSMQWCDKLSNLFEHAYACLKPGGMFTFSTLTSQSLNELKAAWQQADKTQDKATQHVNDFHHKDVVLAHAKAAGFKIVQAHIQPHTVTYPSVKALLLDLKRVGAHNMSSQQTQGLMGKSHFNAMLHAYEVFKTPESTYPLTYEMAFIQIQKK